MLIDSAMAKDMFLDVLVRAKAKYCFAVHRFVVMSNHFHLLLKPLGRDSLAEIMRYVMGVYAMAYNRVHKDSGRLWGGRYFSRPIEGFGKYLGIFECIAPPSFGHRGLKPPGGCGSSRRIVRLALQVFAPEPCVRIPSCIWAIKKTSFRMS